MACHINYILLDVSSAKDICIFLEAHILLHEAFGFCLLRDCWFSGGEAWIDINSSAAFKICQQIFVNLVFVIDKECCMQFFVSPIKIVV